MSAIRFRVYDKKQKKYLDSDLVSILGNGTLNVADADNKYHTIVQPPNDLSPRFIVEQHTNFKDDNSKDIYENDIVRVKHREWVDYEIYQVRHYAPGFDFFPELDSEINGLSLVQSGHYTFEVIGNIHENPELLEEPTSSIRWKPKKGETYWWYNLIGLVNSYTWSGDEGDEALYAFGNTYRTKAECQKAIDRQKAIATLQHSSTFEPDWSDQEQVKYTVYYNCYEERLIVVEYVSSISGEPVYFATHQDAEASIGDHKKEWLLFFGVDRENI